MTFSDDIEFLPFGLPACEDEVDPQAGGEAYKDLYLRDTPFDSEASKRHSYLIVGRRGAGKTALAQSFRFNPKFTNPHYIFVEPIDYHKVLDDARKYIYQDGDVDLYRMTLIWEHAIWSLIASQIDRSSARPSTMGGILEGIMSILISEDEKRGLHETAPIFDLQAAKTKILEQAKVRPIIVAIDTLERYSVNNTSLLRAIAALIQFAKEFNKLYSDANLHIKVLMSGEIFPHLSRHMLENPLKSVRSTVFLIWKPKPLLRLIGYRFYRYLEHNDLLARGVSRPRDWNNYHEVLEKVWNPYFGQHVTNARGVQEDTFPYLLRHTQMRPRQMILLCNQVAALARADGVFPKMHNKHLVEGVKLGELELADEVINAFSPNFEANMDLILTSLRGCSMQFVASELDRRAWGIKAEWRLQEELGKYSADAYRSVLAELGIVGVVTKETEQFIQAEFEYSLKGRLEIGDTDQCVIHPMFYRKLKVEKNTTKHVLPFSPEDLGGTL
jgi:hypothetical protein